MTKPMVLCINREALIDQNIPYPARGIFPFSLEDIQSDEYQFLNRKIVDSDSLLYNSIGRYFPQILPYIAITDGQGKYLSYSRNGTETRLHGSRSIGIGGHVDIYDSYDTYNEEDTYWQSIEATILSACRRELEEEILWQDYDDYLAVDFDKLIVDTSNSVGSVHVGLFTTLVYPNAKPQAELHDAQWITLDELKSNIDEYESWSQIIIKELQ